MMSTLPEYQKNKALRAPDEFLSGLLCIAFASECRRSDGDLDTYPEQEGCWYLVGLEGGAGRLTSETGCVYLESGQALAVSAKSPLDVLYQGEGRLWVLCLRGTAAGSILRRSEELGGSVYPGGAAVLAEVIAGRHAEGGVSPQAGSAAAYQLLMRLYGTGARAVKKEKQLPQVVETALKVLQQDFAFLDGIGDLADRLQVSQEYLTRTFREHVGMTPGKYLNQVRVEHAKLLLQRFDHSVAFVADACGFSNSNYFARVFREHVGVTPSVYAREHSGQDGLPHPMLDSFYVL